MAIASETSRPEEVITDWYLPERDPLAGFVYPNAVSIREHPPLYDIASSLLERAQEKTKDGYREFVVRAGDISYRGHKIDSIEGPLFALRRLPTYIPELRELGLPDPIRQVLMDPWLSSGGLILICGETGQGKSTTCAATVKERMLTHGSFCLTVEDPPEMPLHGPHGNGRCIQTEARSGLFAEALRDAMRCYPTVGGSMLYLGETRDAETAAEVLTIATNGHLVLTTIHASDIIDALRRFMVLAKVRAGEEDARQSLGSVLRLVMHQKLRDAPQVGNQPRRKELSIDFLMSRDRTTPVGNQIRMGKIDSLASAIKQQQLTLKSRGVQGLKDMWA